MKQRLLFFLCVVAGIFPASGQTNYVPDFNGFSGAYTTTVPFDRMIPPHGLEVTFYKTVHLIFPAAIRYVDLGSSDIIAGKADGSENVLRVKAAAMDFEKETNMAVITEDGSYYTFNVRYREEPEKLNIEMKDFLHDGAAVNRPNNSIEVLMEELGQESPMLVRLIMRSIHKSNKSEIRHIGCRRFGIQYTLKSIYSHNDLLYFHMELANSSSIAFDVDYINFKVVDKKTTKRTAIQEQVITPLRAHNLLMRIEGRTTESTVFALPKFTLPDNKMLVVELSEKNGGRNQVFTVDNADLVKAKLVDELKVK